MEVEEQSNIEQVQQEAGVILKNRQFLCVYGISLYYSDGYFYTVSDGRVTTALSAAILREQNNRFKYPEFIRNVRLQYKQPKQAINVLSPAAAPQKQPLSQLLSMLPMMIMMIAMMVMRTTMYGSSRNKLYGLMYGAMYSVSMLMTIIMFITNRKKFKKQKNKMKI